MINASYLPNPVLAELVGNLESNQAIFKGEEVIAFFTQESQRRSKFLIRMKLLNILMIVFFYSQSLGYFSKK